MRKAILTLLAIVALATFGIVYAQQNSSINANITISSFDPCQSNGTPKQSKSVSISTATTTEIIAAVAGQVIYVCGFEISVGNASVTTSATAQFEYGTKVTNPCDTGTTALTGTVGDGAVGSAAVQAFPFQYFSGATAMSTPAAKELCLVSAGTSVNIQGFVAYVQQ